MATREVLTLRLHTTIKSVLRLAGITLVLLGAYNMFAPVATSLPLYAPYRFGAVMTVSKDAVIHAGDVFAMASGAVLAWFI